MHLSSQQVGLYPTHLLADAGIRLQLAEVRIQTASVQIAMIYDYHQ